MRCGRNRGRDRGRRAAASVVVEARRRGLAGRLRGNHRAHRNAGRGCRRPTLRGRMEVSSRTRGSSPTLRSSACLLHGVSTMSAATCKVIRYDAAARPRGGLSRTSTGGTIRTSNPAFSRGRDGQLTAFFSSAQRRAPPRPAQRDVTTGRYVEAGHIGPVARRRTVPPSTPRRTGLALPRPAAIADGVSWPGVERLAPRPSPSGVRRALGPGARVARGPAGQRPYASTRPRVPARAVLSIAYTERHPVSGADRRPLPGLPAQERLPTRADGRWVGGRSSVPLPSRAGDSVEPCSYEMGAVAGDRCRRRPWRPVIVYARGVDGRTVMTAATRASTVGGGRLERSSRLRRDCTSSWSGHFGARPALWATGSATVVVVRQGHGVSRMRARRPTTEACDDHPSGSTCFRPAVSRGDGPGRTGGLHLRQAGSLDRFRHRLYVRYITARG